MPTIRQAIGDDLPSVTELLEGLDLGHPTLSPDDFWVALIGPEVTGTANLKDCGTCLYLSAVGVAPKYQRQGIATTLVNHLLSRLEKDVYLYTQRPGFFGRFGFLPATPPPSIPRREIYGCSACVGDKECVCMVRFACAA